MSTLIIKNDGIGDLILSSGIIGELAEKVGAVDLVTCGQNKEIAEMIPGLRRRLYVSRDGIQLRYKPLKLGIIWPVVPTEDKAIIREIRREHYKRVIVLRRYIRTSSMVLANSVKADSRIGCWLFPTNLPRAVARRMTSKWIHWSGRSAGNEAAYYKDFIQATMGITLGAAPRLAATVRANPSPEGLGLCISGASGFWPEHYWLDLLNRLLKAQVPITVFGGKEEIPLGQMLASGNPEQVRNLAGYLSFPQAAEELSKLKLLISNDTGFAHYATLYAQKVLVILGGGTDNRFFPWPDAKNQFIIKYSLDCYDCNWKCKHPETFCLTRISPASVASLAGKILERNAEKQVWDLAMN